GNEERRNHKKHKRHKTNRLFCASCAFCGSFFRKESSHAEATDSAGGVDSYPLDASLAARAAKTAPPQPSGRSPRFAGSGGRITTGFEFVQGSENRLRHYCQ